MHNIELNVQGLRCGACVKHVTAALQALAGLAAQCASRQ